MKALVIFDSNLGSTKVIAETVAKNLGEGTKAISVSDFNIEDIKGLDLIVVGSPIIGWKPTEKIDQFLLNLENDQLKNIKATSFDTRIKLFMHGDAMKKISDKLKNAGAEILVEPRAFYVKGKENGLFDGEIGKAADWAKTIKAKFE